MFHINELQQNINYQLTYQLHKLYHFINNLILFKGFYYVLNHNFTNQYMEICKNH